jgi:transposase-like protein
VSERVAPFHCPYCGEEDLRPAEDASPAGAGPAWECADCNRAFALRFLGLLAAGLQHENRSEGDSTS